MTHTSDAIASSDFIIRELDLNQEPEMQRESKNFWQDAWAQLKRNKLAVVGMIGFNYHCNICFYRSSYK